ncbi:hypothetical protein [Hymenobacter sp. GOD-10R]|uniref:hypothetical protein n=1 Tax=Hymenobacter sp. GOD-10R TaxID=3093922 RepID=UPI002D7935C8|nr:hypothetical protein [Hymenobacter sp. GOD-10R]WRQ32002.1 hypothetical protein SD425_29800 [Hymenobacter sp. GOD-10R]
MDNKQRLRPITIGIVVGLFSCGFLLCVYYADALAARLFIAPAQQTTIVIRTVSTIFLDVLVLYLCDQWLADKSLVHTTSAGAYHALDCLADWAKWIAAIKTATLGAIGFIIKDQEEALRRPAITVAVLVIGAAVSCSAWVLSSLASIELRIWPGASDPPGTNDQDEAAVAAYYDVYERRLYGFV